MPQKSICRKPALRRKSIPGLYLSRSVLSQMITPPVQSIERITYTLNTFPPIDYDNVKFIFVSSHSVNVAMIQFRENILDVPWQ